MLINYISDSINPTKNIRRNIETYIIFVNFFSNIEIIINKIIDKQYIKMITYKKVSYTSVNKTVCHVFLEIGHLVYLYNII